MVTHDKKFAIVHQIFVLDAYLENPLDCSLQEGITRRFISDALNVLGLEPLAPLGIYPAVDQRAPGWSFIQAITTSHISAHYFEKPGKAPHIRIDAYSCDRLDWQALMRVCEQHFGLAHWRGTFIERDIDQHHARPVIELAGYGGNIVSQQRLQSLRPDLPSSNHLPNQAGDHHATT